MQATLHLRIGPASPLTFWLGFRRAPALPALEFRLALGGAAGDAPVQPVWVRPLTRARDAIAGAARGDVWSGCFTIDALPPSRPGVLRVLDAGRPSRPELASVRWQPQLAEVPFVAADNRAFRVLLASCYYRPQDRGGGLARALEHALALGPLGAALLVGDQVYLDLPTLEDLPKDAVRLVADFEAKYERNWFADGGIGTVMSRVPTATCPDDHEFWNNAPFPSPVVGNSLTEYGREEWKRSARAMLAAFQSVHPPGPNSDQPTMFSVPPLEFFVADTRSARTEADAMSKAAREALAGWMERVNAADRFPVVVLGQPLFVEKKGRLAGSVGDWGMPDQRDFREIVSCLTRAKNDVLILSGDVHWGRVVRASEPARGHAIHEVISSPTALVTSVGRDAAVVAWDGIRSIFGHGKRWPRHDAGDEAPQLFAKHELGPARYECAKSDLFQGDQVAVLAFQQSGDHVKLSIQYLAIDDPNRSPAAVEIPLVRRQSS